MPQPAECSVEAKDLYPAAEGTSLWRVESGADEGDVIEMKVSRAADGAWSIEEPGQRVTRLQWNEDGSCAMHGVDSLTERTRSVFDPPLPMCPTRLTSASPFESSSAMRVESTDTGKERDRGPAARTLTIEGKANITTELGTFDCTVVTMQFTAALRHAAVERSVTIWSAQGIGPIAERTREKVVVLGLFPRTADRLLVKISEKFRKDSPSGGKVGASSP
ncbi:MAG: hypothetical protein K8R92_01315 [Planctomycetes bacterium]|nr:hypothetical protein [Planctomycetota bacterium]